MDHDFYLALSKDGTPLAAVGKDSHRPAAGVCNPDEAVNGVVVARHWFKGSVVPAGPEVDHSFLLLQAHGVGEEGFVVALGSLEVDGHFLPDLVLDGNAVKLGLHQETVVPHKVLRFREVAPCDGPVPLQHYYSNILPVSVVHSHDA